MRHMKKPDMRMHIRLTSGERGIRTPGPLTVNGFQDRRVRPLCHLSVYTTYNHPTFLQLDLSMLILIDFRIHYVVHFCTS